MTVYLMMHEQLHNANVYGNAAHVLPQTKCVTVGCGVAGHEVSHNPQFNSYVA